MVATNGNATFEVAKVPRFPRAEIFRESSVALRLLRTA